MSNLGPKVSIKYILFLILCEPRAWIPRGWNKYHTHHIVLVHASFREINHWKIVLLQTIFSKRFTMAKYAANKEIGFDLIIKFYDIYICYIVTVYMSDIVSDRCSYNWHFSGVGNHNIHFYFWLFFVNYVLYYTSLHQYNFFFIYLIIYFPLADDMFCYPFQ